MFMIGNLKRQQTGGNCIYFLQVPSYQTPCAILIGVAPSKNIKLTEEYQQKQQINALMICIHHLVECSSLAPVLRLASVSWGKQTLRNSLTITWFITLSFDQETCTVKTCLLRAMLSANKRETAEFFLRTLLLLMFSILVNSWQKTFCVYLTHLSLFRRALALGKQCAIKA